MNLRKLSLRFIEAKPFARQGATSLAALFMVLMTGTIHAQSMPSRPALPTAAAPQAFIAPDAQAATLDLSAVFAAKRQAPAEERDGLIRVSRVEDFEKMYAVSNWVRQADGSAVLHIGMKSSGAIGLRTRLQLPAGVAISELRAAGPDGRAESMPVRGTEPELWTPYTEGETQLIELRTAKLPADQTFGQLRVLSLMHFDRSPFALETTGDGLAKESSGSCNVDVKCPSTISGLDNALAERKLSVAHLQFRSGGSGFVCTGTLINSDKFPRAFLVTANHCISTAAEAASLTTFWFYENVACGQRDTGTSGRVQLAGGSAMVITNYMVDSTLLELSGTPPAGTVYAGWNAADLADNTPIVSVSHPRGDPMKYSEGSVTEPRVRVVGKPIDMYGISFTRGVIEGGSSGSGLFTLSATEGLQLRGILSGTTIRNGGMSCTNTNELALYGRFQAFYPNIRTTIMNVAQVASDIDGPMPVSTARQIPLGGSVSAAIDYPGDLDVFRVVVTQPGYLTIYSTGGNDLAGALLDPNGAGLVAEDDVESSNNEFGFTYRITTPGTYYVSVSHWDPTATAASYQVNARFSTAGENYSDIWWNASESGWGLALNHQDNTLAGALYSYDTDGQPLFLILNGANLQGSNTYVGNLVRFTGPAFNASPWLPSQVNSNVVGTMTLSFANRESLNISYTVNGTLVSKSLTRQTFATPPTCTFNGFDRSYASNFQDIWWNPNESGWGLNIIHQGDIIAVGLYNYDATGRNVWYLMAPGVRQTGTATYSGPLKRFTGPVFSASPWSAPTETQVGTMSITFTNGNAGTLTYSVNGQQVVKPIQRLAFNTPRTECESN